MNDTPAPTPLPDFIFKEEQFFGSNGKIVLRRHVVAGREPEKWREFLGVTVVDLPIGENPDGTWVTKKHEITFPFFGISTHVHKNPIKCAQECFKTYDAVEQTAQIDTIEHYKKAVRAHIAKAKEIEDKAKAEGKSIVIPGHSVAGERHLDREGNEIPEPAAKPKKSVIIGA
ncbi:MAG: hypothetical protein WC869_00245 [Phycisphaerae bacterium]